MKILPYEQDSIPVLELPEISTDDVTTIEHLSLFEDGNWRFHKDEGHLTLNRNRSDSIRFKNNLDTCGESIASLGKFITDNFVIEDIKYSSETTNQSTRNSSPATKIGTSGDFEIYVTTRSLQGVIYYLGECLRNKNDHCSYVKGDDDQVSISEISTSKPVHGALLSTSIYGKTYYVPDYPSDETDKNDKNDKNDKDKKENDRTMQTLTFVNQMLNLQKSASAAPTTSNVRVIN